MGGGERTCSACLLWILLKISFGGEWKTRKKGGEAYRRGGSGEIKLGSGEGSCAESKRQEKKQAELHCERLVKRCNCLVGEGSQRSVLVCCQVPSAGCIAVRLKTTEGLGGNDSTRELGGKIYRHGDSLHLVRYSWSSVSY